MATKPTVLVEGKTKIVWESGADTVLVQSKDTITAGDGARRDIMEGKAALATRTTTNCFDLLNRAGLTTHFLGEHDVVTFLARKADQIPFEIVARAIAFGSYSKRNPDVPDGTRFDQLVLECFYKDDARHDPFVLYDPTARAWDLYDPKRPVSDGPIDTMPQIRTASGKVVTYTNLCTLFGLAHATFSILQHAWAEQDVDLVDLKIEGGFLHAYGQIGNIVAITDVVDNDSWRIWPGGVAERMLDKQGYRDAQEVTPAVLSSIKANYAKVAAMTDRFLDIDI